MNDKALPVTGEVKVVAAAPAAAKPAEAGPLWAEVEMKRWHPDRTAWLLTCVDLTSLLVGFFVLLFSTQTLRQDKWQEVAGSFQAQFANRVPIVPVVPDGGNNAVVRVTGVRSGLVYLDTLLHQRVQADETWKNLTSEVQGGRQEITYLLPDEVMVDSPAADAAWGRLGSVLRGWKNVVGIRVTTPQAELGAGSARAVALSAKLAKSGVMNVFADVELDPKVPHTQMRLVVLAK